MRLTSPLPNPSKKWQIKISRFSTNKRTPKTFPTPRNIVYLLPTSTLAQRKLTHLKGWCSKKRLRVLLQQSQWFPDHQLLLPHMCPLVTLQAKREKGAKEVKDLKVLRKGKSHALPSMPQLRMPERPEPNRRKAFLLGPLKVLRGNSSQRPLPRGLPLCWG